MFLICLVLVRMCVCVCVFVCIFECVVVPSCVSPSPDPRTWAWLSHKAATSNTPQQQQQQQQQHTNINQYRSNNREECISRERTMDKNRNSSVRWVRTYAYARASACVLCGLCCVVLCCVVLCCLLVMCCSFPVISQSMIDRVIAITCEEQQHPNHEHNNIAIPQQTNDAHPITLLSNINTTPGTPHIQNQNNQNKTNTNTNTATRAKINKSLQERTPASHDWWGWVGHV